MEAAGPFSGVMRAFLLSHVGHFWLITLAGACDRVLAPWLLAFPTTVVAPGSGTAAAVDLQASVATETQQTEQCCCLASAVLEEKNNKNSTC